MNRPEPAWRRHVVPEIGLSFAGDAAWPLERTELDDGAVVTIRLPEDGAVFVRFGAAQTLDRFLAGLGDLLTAATTLADEPVTILGLGGRRLTVALERRGKAIPGPATFVPQRLQVTAFSVRATPVLLGYRLPADAGEATRAAAERVIGGVEVDLSGERGAAETSAS